MYNSSQKWNIQIENGGNVTEKNNYEIINEVKHKKYFKFGHWYSDHTLEIFNSETSMEFQRNSLND